jgi:hypothetical protein
MSREPGEAPGLDWKKRPKEGAMIPRWRARKKAVALGYRPSVIQLDIVPRQPCRARAAMRSGMGKNGGLARQRAAVAGI